MLNHCQNTPVVYTWTISHTLCDCVRLVSSFTSNLKVYFNDRCFSRHDYIVFKLSLWFLHRR